MNPFLSSLGVGQESQRRLGVSYRDFAAKQVRELTPTAVELRDGSDFQYPGWAWVAPLGKYVRMVGFADG